MTKKVNVLLADDHSVVREGLKSLVAAQEDMAVVGEAGDGATAVQLAEQLRPDVVVMDISMPGLGGAEATERIRHLNPRPQVLALTVHEDRGYVRQLLEAGASGYMTKRAAADELVNAIRTVASGGTYLDPTVAGQVVGGYVRKTGQGSNGEGAVLSDREEEVVRRIAQGFSNKEIASQLEISVKTVETYKARSMEKLGLKSRTDLVRHALSCGWLQ